MVSFIFLIVIAWFLLSVGIGVYQFAVEGRSKAMAVDCAKHAFLFPYYMVKSLFKK